MMTSRLVSGAVPILGEECGDFGGPRDARSVAA
jgi:hypothetical protein